ncbi:MAG TPA: hypothetical protein VE441_05980, partial [Mycobacterium sp.]|nr:hypothetical protein [Mycobacterium sp.]
MLVAALIVLAGSGGAVAALAAQGGVTAPTITSAPPSSTTATAATFAFSDGQSGVSFQCSLDGAVLTPCTSPMTYPGPLALGAHTFGVQARDAKGKTSATTKYTWTVDRTPPPAPTLTGKPASPTNQTLATFSFTDAEAGVTYLCRHDGSAFASCTSPVSYLVSFPVTHTFAVEAVDRAGNTSAATAYTWTLDFVPPPAPSITSWPDNTTATTATFAFTDTEAGVGYLCRLDGS